MKRLNTAVIGLGASYWLHCMPIKELPDLYDFKYICDIDPDRIEKFRKEFSAKGAEDYNQILDDKSIDLVVVATPCKLHKKMTMGALAAGKHVLVEKPIAPSVQEADEMIDAAAKNRRLLTVYHERRLYPDCLFVEEIVKQGTLGKITSIRTADPVSPRSLENTKRWPRKGSGADFTDSFVASHLYDCTVHFSDALLKIVGKRVKRVYCRTGYYPGIVTPCDWEITIEFDGGPLTFLESRLAFFDTRPLHRWEIYGTTGTLVMDFTNEMGRTHVKYSKENGQVAEKTYEARDIADREPFRQYYRRLYRSIVNGEELLVKPEEARDAIKVLHLALESSATGRPVPWRKAIDG